MQDRKIFLIDGHALCYRSFYGISDLTNSKGQPTNAVYGFTGALLKILKQFAPSHIAVCFDTGKKTLRQEKFEQYKIQRPSMPEGLISQLPLIKDVIKAYRIAVFEKEGYEADDLIATIVRKLGSSDSEIVIASDDKDMYQLVRDGVVMYSFRQDQILGVQESKERFGIPPAMMADYISLCGDVSDNIPGVAGIGEVKAKNLINQYGSLEQIYSHLEEIQQQDVRKRLREQKETAFLSKQLALLEDNVPLEVKADDLRVIEPDTQELARLFSELEFRKFLSELNLQDNAGEQAQNYQYFSSGIDECLAGIRKQKEFSIYTQHPDQEMFAPRYWVTVVNAVTLIEGEEIKKLKTAFEDHSIAKVTYDSKALRKSLRAYSLDIQGDIFDVLLAGYLLVSGQSAFDIPSLSWQYLKESVPETDGAVLSAALLRLSNVMLKDLKAKDLDGLYRTLELPLSLVLADLEREGVKIDVDALGKLSEECDVKTKLITSRIFSLSQSEFNINSPKQLSEVLFVKLKLPVIKRTKTGFSTDEEVLSKLALKHEIAQVILEYRQITKLKSTYIDALPKLVNNKTNRLHTTFNQTGAETGRLSSNNPNLQNIPIRTELGREIRRAFIPFSQQDELLSADYSQIELRILAHLSEDENLIKAFKEDEDIHAYTAGLIFDVPENKVDAQMRNAAKRVNFGIIYGISAFGLAKDLGVGNPEAQDFIDRYFLRYPKVKSFMDSQIKKAQESGYVKTVFNRRRYIPEINSKNIGLRQFAERQAINTPVQGSAADLMKMAMIKIADIITQKKLRSRMIITVHDELVFNVPSDERAQMVPLVREAMEHVWEFLVPITVSMKAGRNWLQMDKV